MHGQTRCAGAVADIEHGSGAGMAQHLHQRRAKVTGRLTCAQGVQHGQPDGLHHQPGPDRARRGKTLGQGDFMAGPGQQRRCRQPADPRPNNADPDGHIPMSHGLAAGCNGLGHSGLVQLQGLR